MNLKPIGFAMLAAATGLAQTPPRGTRPAFDAFEVATIKPAAPEDSRGGRYIRMQSAHRFQAKNYTVHLLIAAAYNLPPKAISGGPAWATTDVYEVIAATPGEARPSLDEQMSMLRKLLDDRFKLTFHRESKEFSIYVLTVGKSGPRLKESQTPPDEFPTNVSTLFPAAGGGIDHALMPARNTTMMQFASILQRGVLDRPVVDHTGLSGRYDFDLEWSPDETQFGGQLTPGIPDTPEPSLFAAVEQQLGLHLEAARGPIDTLVIDRIERPSAN